MLEDDFTYVIRKALTGLGLSPGEAAKRAGISELDVREIIGGRFSAEVLRKLAPALGLNADAMARHSGYHPLPLDISGIDRLDLPFGSEQVNCWLVREGGTTVLFDAGYQPSDLMKALDGLPDRVFITHGHHDHVGALGELLAAGLPVHAAGIAGTIPMKPGDAVICGSLVVRACDLSGHYTPTLGYHIEGLARPVLVTGDALFAGSIGGCKSPEAYQLALARLRIELAPLPDATILLPGHGPATTLGEERASNPFL